jgi:exopolysaccharide biosynthesis protein
VAVNGNMFQGKDFESIMGRKLPYYQGNWAKVIGWAMSDGELYSPGPADRGIPSLVVNNDGQIRIGTFTQPPADARQIVSGVWQVVTDGKVSIAPDAPNTELGAPAPHTAVGIDRDAKKLILFVVDGRRPDYSVGMRMHQLGEQLSARGFWNAIVLDGGGSSTLVLRGADGNVNVVNRPSDGHDLPGGISMERSVANALGVVIDPAVNDSSGAAATQPSEP